MTKKNEIKANKKDLDDLSFIVATTKPWNINIFNEIIKKYPGSWNLIINPWDLNEQFVKSIDPKYIFFPHWNHIVPKEILSISTCVCFHETDLPFGRGGSPIQNLIANGYKQTFVTALKMTEELDAGAIYFKEPLSLEGLAEEIFIRAAHIIAVMIKRIITENPLAKKQVGMPTYFKRRTPKQSKIAFECNRLDHLFEHIRMLDADGYPKAYMEYGGFRYEISRPALRTGEIIADVRISSLKDCGDD